MRVGATSSPSMPSACRAVCRAYCPTPGRARRGGAARPRRLAAVGPPPRAGSRGRAPAHARAPRHTRRPPAGHCAPSPSSLGWRPQSPRSRAIAASSAAGSAAGEAGTPRMRSRSRHCSAGVDGKGAPQSLLASSSSSSSWRRRTGACRARFGAQAPSRECRRTPHAHAAPLRRRPRARRRASPPTPVGAARGSPG
jgi:hypothetical protein